MSWINEPTPGLGKVWVPEARISYGSGRARPSYMGMLTATQQRTKATELGLDLSVMPAKDIDPAWRREETIWASVTHNGRVGNGANLQVSRTVGTTVNSVLAAGILTAMAFGNAGQIATAATDKSISSGTQSVSTNEHTTADIIRTAGTVGTVGSTPGSVDGTLSFKVTRSSLSITGNRTVNGSALFDSTTVAGSWMWIADLFSSAAVAVSGDTLNSDWTIVL